MHGMSRGLWIALGALVMIALVGPMLGSGMMGPGMMGWYGAPPFAGAGWMWGLGMGLGGLMMVIFWGALVAIAVLLFGRAARSPLDESQSSGESAQDILNKRFAAGEITRQQYDEMRRVLEPVP